MHATQCRMARAALKLSVRDLAKLAHVATGTIVRLEAGETLQPRTVEAIQHALEKPVSSSSTATHQACG